MSLDVYLTLPGANTPGGQRIYVRDNGATKVISREEWGRRNPGVEPCTVNEPDGGGIVYEANITHNLNTMAEAAGIYEYLWRPEEVGVTKARQLIEPLTAGLLRLTNDPEKFLAFSPSNGWGTYEGLCVFVSEYLDACEEYPDADVSVSR